MTTCAQTESNNLKGETVPASQSQTNSTKPLGCKSYGSILHLPNSRLGPSDRCITEGQARIATKRRRDKHDRIIVQEKLDGSCVSVAKVNGRIVALGRAGYLAESSPFEQHHMFAEWVNMNEEAFWFLLNEGERVVGEWIAQAHGTVYRLQSWCADPFFAFDLMTGKERLPFDEFRSRVKGFFQTPTLLSDGPPISVAAAMERHESLKIPCDQTEGVVYRVERKGKVDFLCKWVRPSKVDGKLLPKVSGLPPVWNWHPFNNPRSRAS
jgi:hypothetical protein